MYDKTAILQLTFLRITCTLLTLLSMLLLSLCCYDWSSLHNSSNHCTGPDHNVETAGSFIQDQFLGRNMNKGKIVYPHFTTATDTSNIKVVFKVVLDTIIRENLEAANLL